MNKLTDLIHKKPYLVWYVKNKKDLSQESIVEHVLNFGNWEDYLEVEKVLGIQKTKQIFEKLISRTRVNLRKKNDQLFFVIFPKICMRRFYL
jgi:hypothetical protein